jgi:hypothetical protein
MAGAAEREQLLDEGLGVLHQPLVARQLRLAEAIVVARVVEQLAVVGAGHRVEVDP